ncbi:MAG: hypothetical protein AAF993_23045, partial [Pseudomonadota bacterium]
MKPFSRVLAVVVSCLVLTACDGPFIFMSGGKLSGPVVETPAVWQLEEDYGFIQLETRPDEPYSVNLAYVQMNGRFYVYAGDTRTEWVAHIESNPMVRVRVEDNIYAAEAVRVEDDDEIVEFAGRWASRSVFQR